MDKQQEIKILQSLKGDTYFNQYFNNHDIDQMCENIRNDFAIESACQFNQKSAVLQRELNALKECYKEQLETFAASIIDSLDGDIPDELYNVLWEMSSPIFVIKHKREKGHEITNDEIDYLIKKASV